MMSNNQIIEKLKKGSLWIGLISALTAVFYVVLIVMRIKYVGLGLDSKDGYLRFSLLQSLGSLCISMGIMLTAAWMFFRIAKAGVPFIANTARIVRIIGIVLLLNAAVSMGGAAVLCGTILPGLIESSKTIVLGMLFLFFAHIIRYGAMLQQEADETL